MQKYLGKYAAEIYALLRIVAGAMFACHGAQKLFDAFGGNQMPGAMRWVAGGIEFFGGLLIALGLFASWAAFLSSGLMAAAYFIAHFPNGFWPIVNQGELAVLYCFVFLYIASRGAGKWSIASAASNPGLS